MQGFLRVLGERHDARRLHRFFSQYKGRTLIVHNGLAIDWLEELFKLGGGAAGHLRINVTRLQRSKPAPVEWVVHEFLLPLQLPLPLLCDIGPVEIQVRHLTIRQHLCHPADISGILDDMRRQSRCHARLKAAGHRLIAQHELPPDDNRYDIETGDH
ncbi:MAG: hypothetical protein ACYCXG_07240 [Acidiferrobacter sp.]